MNNHFGPSSSPGDQLTGTNHQMTNDGQPTSLHLIMHQNLTPNGPFHHHQVGQNTQNSYPPVELDNQHQTSSYGFYYDSATGQLCPNPPTFHQVDWAPQPEDNAISVVSSTNDTNTGNDWFHHDTSSSDNPTTISEDLVYHQTNVVPTNVTTFNHHTTFGETGPAQDQIPPNTMTIVTSSLAANKSTTESSSSSQAVLTTKKTTKRSQKSSGGQGSNKSESIKQSKPVSAYALFFRDTQTSIKAENPSASFGEISKIVASKWELLPKQDKDVYKDRADQEKRNYMQNLASNKAKQIATTGTTNEQQIIQETHQPELGVVPSNQTSSTSSDVESTTSFLLSMVDHQTMHSQESATPNANVFETTPNSISVLEDRILMNDSVVQSVVVVDSFSNAFNYHTATTADHRHTLQSGHHQTASAYHSSGLNPVMSQASGAYDQPSSSQQSTIDSTDDQSSLAFNDDTSSFNVFDTGTDADIMDLGIDLNDFDDIHLLNETSIFDAANSLDSNQVDFHLNNLHQTEQQITASGEPDNTVNYHQTNNPVTYSTNTTNHLLVYQGSNDQSITPSLQSSNHFENHNNNNYLPSTTLTEPTEDQLLVNGTGSSVADNNNSTITKTENNDDGDDDNDNNVEPERLSSTMTSDNQKQTLCARNGCQKQPIDSSQWDTEFCSEECCVRYCADVFRTWTSNKIKSSSSTTSIGATETSVQFTTTTS